MWDNNGLNSEKMYVNYCIKKTLLLVEYSNDNQLSHLYAKPFFFLVFWGSYRA